MFQIVQVITELLQSCYAKMSKRRLDIRFFGFSQGAVSCYAFFLHLLREHRVTCTGPFGILFHDLQEIV